MTPNPTAASIMDVTVNVSTKVFNGVSHDHSQYDRFCQIRKKLERVLSDKSSLLKSARVTFEQFDKDKSGYLDVDETRELLLKLCTNLQVPPIDDAILSRLMGKYDNGEGLLDIQAFARMYYDMLLRVRDKYYPTKAMRVRRKFFIDKRTIDGKNQIEDYFTFSKKLGTGSFGSVYLVKEKRTGNERVMKIINKDQVQVPVEQVNSEIEIMKELDHPNIIKIFEAFEDFNNVYIVMENCKGGELMSTVIELVKEKKALSESAAAEVMKGVFSALACCHAKNIAHKDLKPENIMFSDESEDALVKVIDFGVAECFHRQEDMSSKAAGTALYMAPEVYLRKFGLKCDVWSAGCILYLLLTARLPFVGKSMPEMKKTVLGQEPCYDEDCSHLSTGAIDVLRKTLAKDPRKRASARDIIHHPWFEEAGASTVSPVVAQEVGDSMLRFMRQPELKNAIANLLAHELNMNGAKMKSICQLFYELDKDDSGSLSHDELVQGLRQSGWEMWDIQRVIQAIDVDDSGEVQYNEFVAACVNWREEQLNTIWSAFQKLDISKDGKVDRKEFGEVLLGTNQKILTNEEIDAIMEQIDSNGDGVIEWDEFLTYVRTEQ